LPRVDSNNAHAILNAPWVDLTGWSIGQVSQLADIATGTWARPRLAEVLMALGRVDEARTLVIDDPAWDRLHLTWRVKRYSLVGDAAAAERLLREAAPPVDEFLVGAKMQVEYGLRDFDALWPLAAKRDPKRSVMSAIQSLTLLIDGELDAGAARARVEPALAAIDALFADPFRTQYDRGVEGSRRNEVAMLRARLDLASGHQARAQAQVEADLKGVSTLLDFAKDAYGRAALLRGLLGRAAMVGRPDIALKTAKLIPLSYRSESAAPVARAFLPGAPGDALKALDQVASDPAKRLLDGRGLLAELWSAVLPAGALAGAA